MEDNIQTIVMTLIAIIVFFIFPTYVAYEKKDDISYLLSLKYTQEFVDSVRNKGYLSKEMYSNYVSKLAVTGNQYEINLEHRRKTVEPVTNYYRTDNNQERLVDYRNQESRIKASELPSVVKPFVDYLDNEYSMIENTYRMDEEVISSKQILEIIAIEDFYQMNVGDEFTAIIKNTNTTFATIIYNAITINDSDVNTRIYINYGGSIINETWRKAKVYKEYNTPVGDPIGDIEEKFVPGILYSDYIFPSFIHSKSGSNLKYEKNFVLEFEALPEDVTQIPTEGVSLTPPSPLGPRQYNFLIKDVKAGAVTQAGMGVSVGVNGVTIILHNNNYYGSVLSYNSHSNIDQYTKFKIVVVNNQPTLYINGIKVATGIILPLNPPDVIYVNSHSFTEGYSLNQDYKGHVKNLKIFTINIS